MSLNFREVLAKQLIGDYCTRKKAGQGSHVVRPLPLLHFPIRLPTDSGPKRPSVRREKKGVIHTGIVENVIYFSVTMDMRTIAS